MWWASTSFATSERRVHSVVAVFLAARDATVEPQEPPPTTTTRMFMGATLLVPEFHDGRPGRVDRPAGPA